MQLDSSGNCVAKVNTNTHSKAMELNDNDLVIVDVAALSVAKN